MLFLFGSDCLLFTWECVLRLLYYIGWSGWGHYWKIPWWSEWFCRASGRIQNCRKDICSKRAGCWIGQESKCFPKSLRYGIFYLKYWKIGICEDTQRFCWVNVSKTDQNRVPSLTCVRLELNLKYDIGEPEATCFRLLLSQSLCVAADRYICNASPGSWFFADLLFHGNRHTLEVIKHIWYID